MALLLIGHACAQVGTQPLLGIGNSSPVGALVLRGSGGLMQTSGGPVQLSGVSVSWITSAVRVFMVFDSPTVPANGAVNPAYCYVISPAAGSAIGSLAFDWTIHPLKTQTGMVIAVSTNASGCGQLTLDGNNNFFDLQAVAP
jgi:hypothetical protein